MSAKSINKISSQDLKEINDYIDSVRKQLDQTFSSSKITEITRMIREQIFQDIELQVTLHDNYDLISIIRENMRKNQDIIYSTGKNQILYSLTIPTWSTIKERFSLKGSPQKSNSRDNLVPSSLNKEGNSYDRNQELTTTNTMDMSERDDNRKNMEIRTNLINDQDFESSQNLAFYTFITLLVYFVFTLVTDAGGYFLSLFWLPAFSFITLKIKKPTPNWIGATLFLVVINMMMSASESYLDVMLIANLFLLQPLVMLTVAYRLNSANLLPLKTLKNVSGDLLHTLVFAGIGSLLWFALDFIGFSMGLDLGDELAKSLIAMFGIIIISPIFIFVRSKMVPSYLKGEELNSITRNKNQSVPTQSLINKQTSPTSFPTNTQQSKANLQELPPSYGNVFDNSILTLRVDHSESKKYLGFTFVNLNRLFLIILTLLPLVGILFLYSIDRWAVLYYADLIGYPEYPGNDNLRVRYFREDAAIALLTLAFIFWISFCFAIILEMFRSYSRRNDAKVVRHLLLRTGRISGQILMVPPPHMTHEVYYEILGKLRMASIIEIEHQEAIQ